MFCLRAELEAKAQEIERLMRVIATLEAAPHHEESDVSEKLQRMRTDLAQAIPFVLTVV